MIGAPQAGRPAISPGAAGEVRTLAASHPTDLLQRLLQAGIALLPLVCWPGLEQPFSSPKLWLIGLLAILAAAQYLFRKPDFKELPAWPWLVWISALSLSATVGPYVSLEAVALVLLPPVLCVSRIEPTKALLLGSVIVSALALLQYFGIDPFLWFGWQPEVFASPRMRVYATLGNPVFVAAWLCATLPLCACLRGIWRVGSLALHFGAIFATGSRIFLLALPTIALLAFCAPELSRNGSFSDSLSLAPCY